MVELLTPSAIRSALEEFGISPSRALGQNFLAEANTARQIVRAADVGAGDRVLEIGPGIGSLTLALVDAGATVTALELDRHVIPVLDAVLTRAGARGAVTVVHGDALVLDIATLVGEGPWSMVANLPYNVATPVLLRVLDDVPAVTRVLVMVQKEVAERLAAGPGRKAYGYPSVRVAYYGTARLVGVVPPTVFIPQPKVDSALVAFERYAAPPVSADPHSLFELAKAGFGQRRKMLRRALRPLLGDETDAILERAGLATDARAEQLGIDEWAAIAEARA